MAPLRRRRAKDCGELLDFEEVRRRLRLGTRQDIGRREVPIAEIIGSVNRAGDFDGCFRPRRPQLRRSIMEIRAADPPGLDRPLELLQVDHAYFVEDGHKRLSMAIEDGRVFVDAEVGRYETPFHVAPGATMDAVRATHDELRFREVSGLDLGAPGARFPLTDPDGYLELAESVKAHAYDLSHERGHLVSRAEGAAHWYQTIFRPVVALGDETSGARLLVSSTEADRFLLIRRGIRESMDPGWKIPETAIRRVHRNAAAASGSGLGGAIRGATAARRRPPTVLPEERAVLPPDPERHEDRPGG